MSPQATPPIPDLSEPCSDEEIFVSLENFEGGGPLPANVRSGVNPYHSKPEDLSSGIWYFIVLRSLVAWEHGAWKAARGPSRIFTNDSITGWRTTYEYHHQPSLGSSTADLLMQEYTITRNGKDDKTVGEDTSALCRVHRNRSSLIVLDLPQGHGLFDTSTGTPGNSGHMLGLDFIARQGEASTSNRQANDADAAAIVARYDPVNQDIVADDEEGDFERDYLELDDLRGSESPSSSSGNSSCMTMSPNECSATPGLRDADNKFNQELKEKGNDHEFDMISVKPDRILTRALPLGDNIVVPGSSTDHASEEVRNKRVKTASYPYTSASSDEAAGQTLPKQETREEIQSPRDIPPEHPQAPPTPSPKANTSTRKSSATERIIH
ncbi:hypothetical protein MLD38_022273 [Melastoma candidum]|uniref:Uncharacterized protein n=1 Tax=Melastoma candidum TaxID=119954 RepID=A0ACB9QIK8_9MYRT|nr:hypothetical protein MLD38_022273 [Melastoma candidum]